MLPFLRAAWLPLLLAALVSLWIVLERSPESRPDAVTLRWVINSSERDRSFYTVLQKAFEAKHPQIHIQFIKQNEGNKVETMIAGGDAPDIISIGEDKLHYYLEAGVFRDLTPMISPSDRDDLRNFFPVCLNPFMKNGHVYALPWSYVPFILFYNKNLFDREGLTYPNDHWTWNDYRAAAKRLTRDVDGDGLMDEFGASFAQWQDGYYCWFVQNGGRVLSPDGKRATFTDPKVVEAVQFLHTLTRYDRTIPTDENKPKAVGTGLFEAGKLAMNGPTGSFYIPAYRQYERVDWDIASVPAGPSGKGTIVAPQAHGVSAQSRHPREAYELVKFVSGPDGQMLLGQSGLFVPCRRSVAFSDEFLKAPGAPANKYALVAMMDDRDGKTAWGIAPPWAGDRWGDVNDEALNAKLGPYLFGLPKPGETAESVCAAINKRANEILDEDRAANRGVPVPWARVGITVGAALLVAALIWAMAVVRTGRRSKLIRSEQAWGYFAIAPWLVGFLVFGLGPILFSMFLSLTRWSSLEPPSAARFVGLDHYHWLLGGHDELFHKALLATVRYVVLSLPLYLVSGLAIALLMNSKLKGVAFFRTLYYLPAIMPGVAAAVLFTVLFRQQGLLNYVLGGFGHVPLTVMPDWLHDPKWAVTSIVLMGLWGVGGGMMIYLAGLQNIPTQLYEAAQLDGAGIWTQFRNVTLPMLSPTIFFNLVMGIIGAFQVFTSAFVLFAGTAGPEDAALFYSFYLYRKAFEQFQVGYGSALAWILFLIILFFTALVFRSSSFWVYYEGQKEKG
jgi:multiple sugar transport system permease protein